MLSTTSMLFTHSVAVSNLSLWLLLDLERPVETLLLKVAAMRDSIMLGQHEFTMRRIDSEELGSEEDNKGALEDLAYNADLFIANQEVNVLE